MASDESSSHGPCAETSDPVELAIFSSRVAAVCDEMGAVLRRTAFSPNIRDRLDFSCAVFSADGGLVAQAAHIPVHLGSMAYAMTDVVKTIDWQPGDVIIFNDPYLGGTHLPDVTLVAPVFRARQLIGFAVNRAHHADIGSSSPGSMPLSRSLREEGLVIPPTRIYAAGEPLDEELERLTRMMRNPRRAAADLAAQASSVRTGGQRLSELIDRLGVSAYQQAVEALNDYAERLVRGALQVIPRGSYTCVDYLDDDGQGNRDLPICATVELAGDSAVVSFAGSSAQVAGNVNCPVSVTAAAVYYVMRCLMPAQTPACAGSLRAIEVQAPPGCLLNAEYPAAVAAGNVETSSRIVDAVCGALAQALPQLIPAASHGSMNNLALGGGGEITASDGSGQSWDYYETIAGGAGAGPCGPGRSAIHTHMTNTLNTPIEALEMAYPLRIRRYAVRRGSGGCGKHRGGDGVIREYEILVASRGTLISERRRYAPWGMLGGEAGKPGQNLLNGEPLPGKCELSLQAGDRLCIASAGGGGWGAWG